ncbi:MAG: hypothetical protein LBT71_02905 [Azoarcus sp.]|jgi:hypothetical protein|nr:hypothetical protein [Azoarcus sp.]
MDLGVFWRKMEEDKIEKQSGEDQRVSGSKPQLRISGRGATLTEPGKACHGDGWRSIRCHVACKATHNQAKSAYWLRMYELTVFSKKSIF